MNAIALDYQTPARMGLKRQAVPLPADLKGKSVLDVGCDMAQWMWLCAERGAARVVGVDRNRDVRGAGHVDLLQRNYNEAVERGLTERCNIDFRWRNLGKQWMEVPGRFDVVLCLSMYHHWFENCGHHQPIWFWLWRHCKANAELLWEGPVDDSDPVVRANVSPCNRAAYTRSAILGAASEYFTAEKIGPALHEPTREVWRFRPRAIRRDAVEGEMVDGVGGATKAFKYANGRRIEEIANVIGIEMVPGSLNIRLDSDFDFGRGYYPGEILDVVDRYNGFDSPWAPRRARFYPVTVDGVGALVFRFEGEEYNGRFVELISDCVLRDRVAGPRVVVQRC
ncbi:MAG: methyltransferase domain-containing protein [Pseudolabrys sp.]